MFVGHALLAFTLVAWTAVAAGRSRERALRLAALAAGFAALPDVDMAYAPMGLVGASATGAVGLAETFWRTGNAVHRTVTHSLVVGAAVAVVVVLWLASRRAPGSRGRALAAAALAGTGFLVAVVAVGSGPLGGVVMALFALGVLVLAEAAGRADVGPLAGGAVALAGTTTHPFGDLFTGTPPAFLYPFDVTLFARRVVLHSDPTLHLLAAFGIELAVVWLAVFTFLWLTDLDPGLAPEVTLGAGYAGTVLFIPAPTLELSYPFVFSVLAVSALGLVPRIRRDGGRLCATRPDPCSALFSGLAAVTVAWAAYTVAYLLL